MKKWAKIRRCAADRANQVWKRWFSRKKRDHPTAALEVQAGQAELRDLEQRLQRLRLRSLEQNHRLMTGEEEDAL